MEQIDWMAEIRQFFTEDLKNMCLNILKKPATGYALLEEEKKSIVVPTCMTVLSFLVVTILSFLVIRIKTGDMWAYMNMGFGTFMGVGLFPVFFALFFTLIMYGLMAVKKQADIMQAFKQSAAQVLLLTAYITVALVIMLIFFKGKDLMSFNFSSAKFGLLLISIAMIYYLSLAISYVRQSLKQIESESGECLSWYTAPLVVALSIYLACILTGAIL